MRKSFYDMADMKRYAKYEASKLLVSYCSECFRLTSLNIEGGILQNYDKLIFVSAGMIQEDNKVYYRLGFEIENKDKNLLVYYDVNGENIENVVKVVMLPKDPDLRGFDESCYFKKKYYDVADLKEGEEYSSDSIIYEEEYFLTNLTEARMMLLAKNIIYLGSTIEGEYQYDTYKEAVSGCEFYACQDKMRKRVVARKF